MEKSKEKNLFKNSGITLIALVITVIVLLILAGVTVATLTGDNGLLGKAGNGKIETEKAEIRETIELECISLEGDKNLKGKTDKEKLEILVERLKTRNGLEEENTDYVLSSKFLSITTKHGAIFTVLYDYTIIEGRFAYLDIADGSIQLKETGYIQGNNDFVAYTGRYIITGTTTENTISIIEKGIYDITIKDLEIDVSATSDGMSAFNANKEGKQTGCFVDITLEGNNRLLSSSGAAGLQFERFKDKYGWRNRWVNTNNTGEWELRDQRWSLGLRHWWALFYLDGI